VRLQRFYSGLSFPLFEFVHQFLHAWFHDNVFFAVGKMLFFDSEKIPHASSEDFDEPSKKREKSGFIEQLNN
jgi:hypothetical protein